MCLFHCVSCLCSYLLPPVFHLILQSLSEYTYIYILSKWSQQRPSEDLANEKCLKLSNVDSFDIIDQAKTRFALKLKEALHIKWDEPDLNKQVRHEVINIAV